MKTIIELPDNLPPNGIGLALRAIADDILIGAVVPVPPFCYCIDTAVGTVTFWDVDNEERIAPADNRAHPPLNTPLSAFTPAMLDALPVGSRFGRSVLNCYVMEKRADGWYYPDGDPAGDFGPGRFDPSRPLIRVGPEQASETGPSATLPDPWPGLLFEWVDGDWIRRDRVKWSFTNANANTRVTVEDHPHKVDWAPNHIREVRTPDGVTLWKLPAGGAS